MGDKSDVGGALVLHALRPSRVVALHRRLAQYLYRSPCSVSNGSSDDDNGKAAAAVMLTADLARAVAEFCDAREVAVLSAVCADLRDSLAMAVHGERLWARFLLADFNVDARAL